MSDRPPPILKCFSSPGYFAPLPPGHVFPMSKFPESARRVEEQGIGRVIAPGGIDDRDLLRGHTPEYVESIRAVRYNETRALKPALPWSPELSGRSHRATAGT